MRFNFQFNSTVPEDAVEHLNEEFDGDTDAIASHAADQFTVLCQAFGLDVEDLSVTLVTED